MARKSIYYIPKMCFFVTQSNVSDQATIQNSSVLPLLPHTVNEQEIQRRMKQKEIWDLK